MKTDKFKLREERKILGRLEDFKKLVHKRAWVGLDGFIDRLMVVIKARHGIGDQFEPYHSLKDLGQAISTASGNNLNLELYPKFEKIGGNGPLLANVLLQMGISVQYTGPLGNPLHPLFQNFAEKTQAISLGEPGITHALECQDGKLILGHTSPMDAVTYEALLKKRPLSYWIETCTQADLVAFQNWTMLYGMTPILHQVIEHWLPHIVSNEQRLWFFDLADPSKRTQTDLQELLSLLPAFKQRGKIYLALNRHEVQMVCRALGVQPIDFNTDPQSFKNPLQALREHLEINGLIVHSKLGAMGVTTHETAFAPALKAKQLQCLTGSGDHFNGGFLCGYLMDWPLEDCLQLGHIVSVLYIETACTPTLGFIKTYLENLREARA